MIEPAALGKATIVGPFTGNFAEAMRAFKVAQAIVEVPDQATLAATVSALLRNPDEARSLGARAQARDVDRGVSSAPTHRPRG